MIEESNLEREPAAPSSLDEVLRDAVTATLDSLGICTLAQHAQVSRWSTWPDPVAFIGCKGENDGSMAVGTSWSFLRKTDPSSSTCEEDLLDWSRELANLLLGGLKTALLRRGIKTRMGLPVTVSGRDVVAATNAERTSLSFDTSGGVVVVSLDLSVSASAQPEVDAFADEMTFF